MKLLSRRMLVPILPFLSLAAWPACAEPQARLAQAQIEIPSNAQLDRMEQREIVTPPLYDGGAVNHGDIAAIGEKMLRGGICSGC